MANKPHEQVSAFDQRHYVPCVRWKQGEYQAILRLTPQAKERITPLIEVPEVGFDFEKGTDAKTVDQHLEPFAKRVEQKWGRRACFVDLNLLDPAARMADQTHPVDYVFAGLRERECAAIPVTGLDRDTRYQNAVRRSAQHDRRGVCLRLGLTEAVKTDVRANVERLIQQLGVEPAKTDLGLDLDAPASFVPVEGFVALLLKVVKQLPHRDRWRTFTLVGTSFPQTMGGLREGPHTAMRYEWIAYKLLATKLSNDQLRVPTFGDYGISHPDVLRIDMRKAKPSATIRYTVDDAWYILKGKNVRDHGYEQYQGLCSELTSSRHFGGRQMSWADGYIEDCATGNGKTGNLTMWRCVGTNHHIEKVTRDIASWFAS